MKREIEERLREIEKRLDVIESPIKFAAIYGKPFIKADKPPVPEAKCIKPEFCCLHTPYKRKPESKYKTHHISIRTDENSDGIVRGIVVDHTVEPDKPEPKCTCFKGSYVSIKNPRCPVHPESLPTPPLPLKARVAEALGDKVELDALGVWHYRYMGEFPCVPDYPDDLALAMGALEEYCRLKCWMRIDYNPWHEGKAWQVTIGVQDRIISANLPEAICEAIVAHAERGKA